jgi:hypothetical protein
VGAASKERYRVNGAVIYLASSASSLEKRSQAVICHLPFVILNAFLLRTIDHCRHVACSHLRDLRPPTASPAAISVTVIIGIRISSGRGADANPVA